MAKREMLHMDFAAQLESMGLWHWSIFVLLHLQDPFKRAKLARDVLGRNVMPSDEESVQREEFLQERLGVPLAWIADAKAVRAATEANYGDQVIIRYLTKLGVLHRSGFLKQNKDSAQAHDNF